jgi:hypothetical protein
MNRRNFLALVSAVPPVCKAMLSQNREWARFARELSHVLVAHAQEVAQL